MYASLKWLKNMDAIDAADIDIFNEIKVFRNELVHEIVDYISKNPEKDILPLISKITDLLDKIEGWWILNVEIPTDPDLYDKEIDEQGIMPGPIMAIRLLIDISLGTEEESKFYYSEYLKRRKGM